jgi:hypothetical protein
MTNTNVGPLRLAVGSHKAGSGRGCAMNVISWENGDSRISDMPDCTHPFLSRVVQRLNDSICEQRDGGLLCADCSVIVLGLAHRTVGTADADPDGRVMVRIAAEEAQRVAHLNSDPRVQAAIDAALAWADTPTDAAANAAYAAALDADAAANAAYAAALDADAAANAAYAARAAARAAAADADAAANAAYADAAANAAYAARAAARAAAATYAAAAADADAAAYAAAYAAAGRVATYAAAADANAAYAARAAARAAAADAAANAAAGRVEQTERIIDRFRALTGHDTTAPDPTVTAQAITRMLQVTA